MKSEKTFFKLPKIISLISIIILLVWNNFSVYALIEQEKPILNTDIINISDDDTVDEIINLKRIDSSFGWFEPVLDWNTLEIEWILEKLIWEGPNWYMEENYILYDSSLEKTFILDLNNILDDSYIWKRVVLSWFEKWDNFIVQSIASQQLKALSRVAKIEYSPEQKNTRKIWVFMVEVSGHSTVWTKDTTEQKIFWETNSSKEYFDATSYGELKIDSDADKDWKNDIFWPFTSTTEKKCEYSKWRNDAIAQAQASWIDTSIYTNILIVLPSYSKLGCGWAWLWNVWSVDASYTLYTWITYASNSVAQHEFWHNFWLAHASTDTNNDGNVNSEYGDQSWVMWGPAGMPLKIWVNAPHLDQLNWWDHFDGFFEYLDSDSWSYILQPLQTDPILTTGTRVVKFPKSNTNDFYYISYRQPVWYNSQMYSKYEPGLTIHTYKWSWYWNTKLVKTLNNDEVFFDEINNIKITSKGIDEDTGWMKVLVEKNPDTCVPGKITWYKYNSKEYFKFNEEWSLNFRITNSDNGCKEQTISNTVNQWTDLVWNFSNENTKLHPKEVKDASFVFNSSNINKEYNYNFSFEDKDWIAPNHEALIFSGSIIIDGEKPTKIWNFQYTKTGSIYNFTWNNSTDNLSWVYKYEIYKDTWSGSILYKTNYAIGEELPKVSFLDSDLWEWMFSYKVLTYDRSWNVSDDSDIILIDNKPWECIFNGGKINIRPNYVSTNTGVINNFTYELINQNLNCNDASFNLSLDLPESMTWSVDEKLVILKSGETATWSFDINSWVLPWNYELLISSSVNDYTVNKLVTNSSKLYLTVNWVLITQPTGLKYVKNLWDYNLSWTWSTYYSGGWSEWWNKWEKEWIWWNNEELELIYEIYKESENNPNVFNLYNSWTGTNFTETLNVEQTYRYYIITTDWKWNKSDKSNIISIIHNIPENITWSISFDKWNITNTTNTIISLIASEYPVKYILSWSASGTWTLLSNNKINIDLNNVDWVKPVSVQYFSENWKSVVLLDIIILDTVKPSFNLNTDVSWTWTTESNITFTGSVLDENWISSFKINNQNIIITNDNWELNSWLNIWENNFNYELIDNALNTLTWSFSINRVNIENETDNIPEAFTFNAISNNQLNTSIISNTVNIVWINTGSLVSINNGEYSINGWIYTTSTWMIFNNDSVNIKLTSSASYSTNITSKLNVWWIEWIFTIKTKSKPSSGWWGWGGWSSRPRCKAVHLVCKEYGNQWKYKYYKLPWKSCRWWDLWKKCEIKSDDDTENKKEEKDIKNEKKKIIKIINEGRQIVAPMLNKSQLTLSIKDQIKELKNKLQTSELESNRMQDISVNNIGWEDSNTELVIIEDEKINKILQIKNNKINSLLNKLNSLVYLWDDILILKNYLLLNQKDLNKVLILLDTANTEKNKEDILKYYWEYQTIISNIKNIENILESMWVVHNKIWENWDVIAYIKYKNPEIRKYQTILNYKLDKKEFKASVFKKVNKYLHYENLSVWDVNRSKNKSKIIYKVLLKEINNLK